MKLFTFIAKWAKRVILSMLIFSFFVLNAQSYQYDNAWGKAGMTLTKEATDGVKVNFSIQDFQLTDQLIEGESMKEIQMPMALLPNDEGMPNVPGFSRMLAIPQGATPVLNVTRYRVETIKDVELAPAPRIPLDTENGPLDYKKNEKVYSQDAFYPANPFQLSELMNVRGVDAVIVGITPFQYNPVSKELLIYRDVEVEVRFEGGNGYIGEDRLRSRWFDPILEDAFLNYQSLPQVDYDARIHQQAYRTGDGYEYLIVVPNNPAWLPYAEQIKNWRTLQGIKTGIVTLAEIGGNTPAILTSYFHNAYNTWDIPPVAVLLMADYGTDANSSITSPIHNNYCVSDNMFADVSGNQMPDMIFARMTAQNTVHLQTMVSKMLDYEADPPTSYNFYHQPITALGWQTERWFQICSETVGGYWREVKNKQPVRINAIYDGTPGTTWSTATNTSTVVNYFGPNGLGYIPATPAQLGGWSGGTPQMVTNAINSGAFALQHRDHGFEQGWGEPDFQSSHINSLTNTQNNQFVYVFSINCLTGKYNHSSECFTEKFHRHTHNGQNAGALGLIAASEISYSFVNDAYVWGLFDNMHPDFMPDYGPFVDERGFLPAFGNAAGKYFLLQSNWPYNTNNKLVTYHLFHQHGGAFMKVYSEVPQNLNVTHNPILYSGESVFTVVADAGAHIALTVNGEIIGTGMSIGGATNITIQPQFPPNTMIVTITKQNFFRYQANVSVIPPSGPYIIGHSYLINDINGNNNGQLDYGESVTMHMTMKNVGVVAANNVSVNMSTDNPYITITDGTQFFGNIAPDATLTVNNAFAFQAAQDIPDGHIVTFLLTSTDGTNTWESYVSVTAHAPSLKYDSYLINDAAGNNNGLLDPGETAPMVVTIKNQGNSEAYSVMASLTSSDPYVSVLTLTPQSIGTLTPGSTGTATFIVAASQNVPAGYSANLTINMEANMGIAQSDVINLLFPDYCYPTANCTYNDGFTGFALEQINNMSSGCSPSGYGDFTAMVAELEAGQTYQVQWKTGYSNQQASLWIDLNDNKDFETSELLITNFVLANANQVYTTTFTVPTGQYSGNKRLRIRANWQNPSNDPCSNFSYGETEDYTVSFGEAMFLPPPQNVSASVTGNSVTISWQEPAPFPETVSGYNVYMDNQMVAAMVSNMNFTHNNCPVGSHWFSVSAVYAMGESGVAQPVHVEIGSMQGKIQGTVRNALTNQVVHNAWVTALNSDFGAVSYSTPFGYYYTMHLPGGTYSIECNAIGYLPLTHNGITVIDGGVKTINFYLYPDADGNPDVTTGIGKYENEVIAIYPNPAKDIVNISVQGLIKHVKITNNMGQLVFDQPVYESELKINTSNYVQGVYLIEVMTEEVVITEKLIIK